MNNVHEYRLIQSALLSSSGHLSCTSDILCNFLMNILSYWIDSLLNFLSVVWEAIDTKNMMYDRGFDAQGNSARQKGK